MNNFPNRDTIERIRREYPAGTRVKLLEMDDCFAPPIGTLGTVIAVDDCADLIMRWDNGSSLNVVFNHDRVVKVTEEGESK
ncbi:MAG: DUF4314 domain-containing protein [Eubacteriales bacterium]|nr:DUF4314 domain-containing protein [Eubacteriales bacterium]